MERICDHNDLLERCPDPQFSRELISKIVGSGGSNSNKKQAIEKSKFIFISAASLETKICTQTTTTTTTSIRTKCLQQKPKCTYTVFVYSQIRMILEELLSPIRYIVL
jgi:hypothetical protein